MISTTPPLISFLPLNRSQPLLSHYAPVKRSSSLSLAEKFIRKIKREESSSFLFLEHGNLHLIFHASLIVAHLAASHWLRDGTSAHFCRSCWSSISFCFFFIASLQLKVHIPPLKHSTHSPWLNAYIIEGRKFFPLNFQFRGLSFSFEHLELFIPPSGSTRRKGHNHKDGNISVAARTNCNANRSRTDASLFMTRKYSF